MEYDVYDSLITDLEYLHKEFTYMLSEHRGKSFLVFHPSFGYFADEYGLKQLAIETGGKEPGPFELEEIIDLNKNMGFKGFEIISSQIFLKRLGLFPLGRDFMSKLGKICLPR